MTAYAVSGMSGRFPGLPVADVAWLDLPESGRAGWYGAGRGQLRYSQMRHALSARG